jgi:uncharacterized coiled-coil protein SlyX
VLKTLYTENQRKLSELEKCNMLIRSLESKCESQAREIAKLNSFLNEQQILDQLDLENRCISQEIHNAANPNYGEISSCFCGSVFTDYELKH